MDYIFRTKWKGTHMKFKLGFVRSMLSGAFALAGAFGTMMCSAQSTQQQVSNSHATSDTEWADTFAVNQFAPSLGTLTSVQVTLTWNTFQSMSATNTDVSDEKIYGTSQTNVALSLPNGNSDLMGASPTVTLGSQGTNQFGRTVPTGECAAGQTVSSDPVSTSSTSSVTLTATADLASFTGSGTISLAGSTATTITETEQGGNIDWATTTQSGASVTVVYTYTPPATSTVGCLTGTMWNNKCGDGHTGHTGESGLCGGIKLDIFDCNDHYVCSTTTTSNGCYRVDNLRGCSSYRVKPDCSTFPSGYKLSCEKPTRTCTIPTTGCCPTVDFPCNKPTTTGCYTNYCQPDWCGNILSRLLKTDCLDVNYCKVYPIDKCLKIGCDNKCVLFDCAPSILNCLPQTGGCLPLNVLNLLDPDNCSLGSLFGELTSCQLNCDFADQGCFKSGFKNLVCQTGKFKGCKVIEICNAAHNCLNGSACIPCVPHCTLQELCDCLHSINTCYGTSGHSNGNGYCK